MRFAPLCAALLLLTVVPSASAYPIEFEDCGNGFQSVTVNGNTVVQCWNSDPFVETEQCTVGFRLIVLGQPLPCIPIY